MLSSISLGPTELRVQAGERLGLPLNPEMKEGTREGQEKREKGQKFPCTPPGARQ